MALAMPKSMILGTGRTSCTSHQHVTGLQIAVDHAFLMRVLHTVAERDEQLQSLAIVESWC